MNDPTSRISKYIFFFSNFKLVDLHISLKIHWTKHVVCLLDDAFDGKSTDLQPFSNDMFVFSENSRFIIESKLNKKLTRLCQMHDEICDIGKTINQMFSFQMLILMAYGFMSLTAKFYFVYCGLTQQVLDQRKETAIDSFFWHYISAL